jgi:hypothetical protein
VITDSGAPLAEAARQLSGSSIEPAYVRLWDLTAVTSRHSECLGSPIPVGQLGLGFCQKPNFGNRPPCGHKRAGVQSRKRLGGFAPLLEDSRHSGSGPMVAIRLSRPAARESMRSACSAARGRTSVERLTRQIQARAAWLQDIAASRANHARAW